MYTVGFYRWATESLSEVLVRRMRLTRRAPKEHKRGADRVERHLVTVVIGGMGAVGGVDAEWVYPGP
jgi:hypothetical protein